jgi:hypothetical protein
LPFAFFDAIYLFSYYFNVTPVTIAFRHSLLEGSVQAHFVDETQTRCANFEANPATFLYIVELLAEQVHIERTLCAVL